MGYNKKVLSKATSELGKAKKPSTPRDKVVDSKGYWNPDNQDKSVVRVPGNSITMGPNPETGEPIPFPIYGIPNVGMPQMMYPGNDYSFSGADYVDEYSVAKKGGSLPSLPKKANSKKYSRSLTATNKLFAQNPLTKKSKSKKNKIFDPNAKYYQDGGELPEDYMELDLTPEEIIEYQKGGYTIEYLDDPSIPQLTKAQEGIVTEPELTYEAPETFAYANKEAEKKHKLLMDKARALMTTAQGRKLWYDELKPKDFTVKELSRFVKGVGDYNKEAQAYQKAKRRMEEDKISTDTFAQLYNQRGWAKFDPNTMQEGYEGQFQDAVNEANRRKEKNMAVTDAFLELTGATALKNIASDPLGTVKGVGTTALDLAASSNPAINMFVNPSQPNVNPLTGEQYWSGLDETLDVAGVAPFFGAAGRLLKGSKFLKNVKPGANTFDIPEQSFKKELYNAYNPETKSYDVYEIDVPQEIIPGRSYADVQHKMKNLRKDLGIGPVEHLMNKTFGRKPVGLAKDSGIVVDPETGQLFDSNTRYWLNREYGNLPKAEEVINKQYLAKNYGKPVASNLSFEDAQKILETPSDKKFTSDFEEATFLKPEESYFQPRTEFERELSSEAERYYTLATSPENIERARMLDQEFGTNYTKALQEMIFQRQNKPVADKYPFNIRVLENPGEGAGGYTSLTPEGAAKKAAGIPTTINDREVVIFSDSPVKDLKRRVPHELSHHKTLSQNNVKALENAWGDKLKNAIDNPGEISKTNPVLADKLMQPAFKDMPDSPTLYEYLSDPAEVDAYLNTNFRDQLVQKGILKNHWDELTDNKLALYFMDEGPKDNMVNVLLDIVKPSEFLEIFNKGIYAIPAAIGTGAMLGSQGNEQTYQEGGIFIDIDNEDDIQRYIDQGYIVEFDEGGFVPSNTIKFVKSTTE